MGLAVVGLVGLRALTPRPDPAAVFVQAAAAAALRRELAAMEVVVARAEAAEAEDPHRLVVQDQVALLQAIVTRAANETEQAGVKQAGVKVAAGL